MFSPACHSVCSTGLGCLRAYLSFHVFAQDLATRSVGRSRTVRFSATEMCLDMKLPGSWRAFSAEVLTPLSEAEGFVPSSPCSHSALSCPCLTVSLCQHSGKGHNSPSEELWYFSLYKSSLNANAKKL